jgi:hypothetical protein
MGLYISCDVPLLLFPDTSKACVLKMLAADTEQMQTKGRLYVRDRLGFYIANKKTQRM